MSTTPDPKVSRPTPSAEWSHDWRHRGRLDVHGIRRLEVRAHFSGNEARDPDDLPNEIVVEYVHGEGRSRETVRMSRAAAAQLELMLKAALAWDGQ